jgi:hypothetical protein
MKKLFATLTVLVFIASITIAQTNTELVDVDCSTVPGFNLVTKAPTGVKPVNLWGSVTLSNDKKFRMSINKVEFSNLAADKKSLPDDKYGGFKKFVLEEPNGVIYESEVAGKKRYHFMYYLINKNGSYYFNNMAGMVYDLESVQLMYQAAKASKVK